MKERAYIKESVYFSDGNYKLPKNTIGVTIENTGAVNIKFSWNEDSKKSTLFPGDAKSYGLSENLSIEDNVIYYDFQGTTGPSFTITTIIINGKVKETC